MFRDFFNRHSTLKAVGRTLTRSDSMDIDTPPGKRPRTLTRSDPMDIDTPPLKRILPTTETTTETTESTETTERKPRTPPLPKSVRPYGKSSPGYKSPLIEDYFTNWGSKYHKDLPIDSALPQKMVHDITTESNPINTRYRIGRTLGEGTFGKVYKAVDLRKKQQVAIKEIDLTYLSQTHRSRYFDYTIHYLKEIYKEYKLIRGLSRTGCAPHIACPLDFFVVHDRRNMVKAYIVMELYDGDLSQIKQSRDYPKVTFEQRWEWVRQLIEGLQTLHSHGILHRDLKPNNVLYKVVNGKINLYLTDFGTVCKTSASQCDMYGTPGYMDPWIYVDKHTSKRSDWFSMGIIFALLFCSTLPDLYYPGTKDYFNNVRSLLIKHGGLDTTVDSERVKRYYQKLVDKLVSFIDPTLPSAQRRILKLFINADASQRPKLLEIQRFIPPMFGTTF